MFRKLFNKASDFLSELDRSYTERPYFVKTVGLYNNNLEDVINKLSTWNLHRIFVVDDFNKPIGVVGIKDVLKEIIFH